jgi:hypothetical protein
MSEEQRNLVIHALMIKGFASTDAVATVTGLPGNRVQEELEGLRAQGLAKLREGRISGWAPTPEARQLHQTLLTGSLASSQPEALLAGYEEFSALNAEFKELCTQWQLRSGQGAAMVPNDHSDPAYDGSVIDGLTALDQRAGELLDRLVPSLPRVKGYRARLGEAVQAVRHGDRDKFTKPLCDSYHDIWMELHQDLILTLGLQRTASDA